MSEPARSLSTFDAVCIIVGCIIGAGIFETSPMIAAQAGSAGVMVLIWVLGGAAALVGALCYAELAGRYPREGGDYVYLSRAYGPRVGLLFAWAEFWIVRPGSVGAMAYVFAHYAEQVWPLGGHGPWAYGGGSVLVLTAINLAGVRSGKLTQNLLTVIKVAALGAICAVGLLAEPRQVADAAREPAAPGEGGSLALALVMVMFTYAGWNDVVFVAGEVRSGGRGIVKALLIGIGLVIVVYLAVNLAFARSLGFEGFAASDAAATEVMATVSDRAATGISVMICLSCLGAINAIILTGSRIYYALGRAESSYRWLGHWRGRLGGPTHSLTVQALVTLGIMAVIGTDEDGFERLVIFTAPVFWAFFMLTGAALFVLRFREPDAPRPFSVPLYPWLPLLFIATSAAMFYAGATYAWSRRQPEAWWVLGILAVGLAVCAFKKRNEQTMD